MPSRRASRRHSLIADGWWPIWQSARLGLANHLQNEVAAALAGDVHYFALNLGYKRCFTHANLSKIPGVNNVCGAHHFGAI